MEHLYSVITEFLKDRTDQETPLLLGFSGGPDSLALFHLLIKYREERGTPFAIAHVDHGWRRESQEEAEAIARMGEDHNVTSHTMTLSPLAMEGNLEAACRDARHQFFAFLCREHGYKAVLLAHHADDQAETVLKRLFEGASLDRLGAMRTVVHLDGLEVWRPLLGVRKKEILAWLSDRGLKGFHDTTNEDVRFLRARMRHELIPYLSTQFGKEVSPALCRLGEEASELEDYLDAKIAPLLNAAVCGAMGFYLDKDQLKELLPLEKKHLIRRFAALGGMHLSRDAIADAASLLENRAIDKCVSVGSGKMARTLHLDNERLFLPKILLDPIASADQILVPGKVVRLGHWEVAAEEGVGEFPRGKPTDWRELWRWGGELALPKGDYRIGAPVLNGKMLTGETLAKRYSGDKAPVLLRSIVPVMYQKDLIAHEFLTGRGFPAEGDPFPSWIKVRVKLAVEGE